MIISYPLLFSFESWHKVGSSTITKNHCNKHLQCFCIFLNRFSKRISRSNDNALHQTGAEGRHHKYDLKTFLNAIRNGIKQNHPKRHVPNQYNSYDSSILSAIAPAVQQGQKQDLRQSWKESFFRMQIVYWQLLIVACNLNAHNKIGWCESTCDPLTVQHVPLSSQIKEYLKSGPPFWVQLFIQF